jgi:hypothetical protein
MQQLLVHLQQHMNIIPAECVRMARVHMKKQDSCQAGLKKSTTHSSVHKAYIDEAFRALRSIQTEVVSAIHCQAKKTSKSLLGLFSLPDPVGPVQLQEITLQ